MRKLLRFIAAILITPVLIGLVLIFLLMDFTTGNDVTQECFRGYFDALSFKG